MHDFTILVLQGAYASSVSITLDMLAATQVLSVQLNKPAPRWRVCIVGGATACLSNGMTIAGQQLKPSTSRSNSDKSIWVVPSLGLSSPEALHSFLTKPDALQAAKALNHHAKNGGEIAASCSAVFLLQSAELLKNKSATTTWWLASELQRIEPTCTIVTKNLIVQDGNITTAGAALAHCDLMLFLIRQKFGAQLAEAIARTLLIDTRHAQSHFILPSMMRVNDPLLSKITEYLETVLPKPPPMRAIAQHFAMSERSFARRVVAATGQSPIALLQSIRLNRARYLLECNDLSVDEVAWQVGYSDSTALRRMMRKMTGMTPRHFKAIPISNPQMDSC